MGWKIFLIIITNAANVETTEVPQKIGFDQLKPSKEIKLQEAQYEQGISVGKHEDKIFIVSRGYVFDFFNKLPSELEKRVTTAFPNSEIAALAIYSVSDVYGYSIIQNGVRQRVKAGADLEVDIDYGNKLQEENDVAKEKLFDKEHLEEMKKDYSKEELQKVIDQEISFRTIFRLSKRYFGSEFDRTDSDYNKISVTLFE
jgi:hypothetical protein